MRSVNKVILLGHLGKDAEARFTPKGTQVASFSIATSRRWKDQATDQWKEETDWHNCILWRSENVINYLTKGQPVYVEGRLQTRSYEDKQGQKRYVTEVVVDELNLLNRAPAKDGSQPVSQPRTGGNAPSQSSGSRGEDVGNLGITDDDVPF